MESEAGTFVREFEIPSLSETLNFYQKIEGDVSCVVWDASIVLSKYLEKKCSENKNYLKDKDVIELGAGLGCVGLTAACLGAHVISSDLKECIPLLNLNINKNEHIWTKYGNIKSLSLKWGEPNDLAITPGKILLADCIYYEESIQPLIETLVVLTGPETEILLCQEMRESENQQKYWRIFMEHLSEYFDTRFIPPSDQNEEFSSPDIVLLSMQKKVKT